MAIFDKRTPYERILDMFKKLPDEDREKFKADIEDIDKAEDEREIDKIEEDKADTTEKRDEKREEKDEESEEIGKEIEETEKGEEAIEEPKEEETEKEERGDELKDKSEEHEDLLAGMNARLKALEELVFTVFKTNDEKDRDVGVSGYGKSRIKDLKDDTREDDLIKILGGRA